MRFIAAVAASLIALSSAARADLAGEVNPFIGTTNGGNSTAGGLALLQQYAAMSPEEKSALDDVEIAQLVLK